MQKHKKKITENLSHWVTAGVSQDLIFTNKKRLPYDWPDNIPQPLDDTPTAPYPNVPAELTGVIRNRGINSSSSLSNEISNMPDQD